MRRLSQIGFYSVVIAMLLPLFWSCNRFEYGFDESAANMKDPNQSELSFVFPETAVVPEHVAVLMSRKVNSLNYQWTIDSLGQVVQDDQTLAASQMIYNGEYYLIAFNKYSDFYTITDYSEFEDGTIRMKDLYAIVPSMSSEELELDDDLLNLNPYSGYVAHTDEPLLHFVDRSLLFPYSSGIVSLDLTDLTREYTLTLMLEAEKSVTIKRIAAIMSGVPTQVQLMSGLVSRKETSKVVFDFYAADGSKAQDGQEMVSCRYEGKIRSLGIFPASDAAMTTGPGILQVFLTTSVDDGPDEVERTFYAGINIKKAIEEAAVMIQSEDRSGYWAVPQNGLKAIEVDAVLKVMKNHIEAGEAEGTEVWFENDAEISPEL